MRTLSAVTAPVLASATAMALAARPVLAGPPTFGSAAQCPTRSCWAEKRPAGRAARMGPSGSGRSSCSGIPARDAFFLKFGLGGMTYKADFEVAEVTATAPSGSFGLGYEIRVGENVSIVPFLNGLVSSSARLKLDGTPISTEDINLNLVHLGIGVAMH